VGAASVVIAQAERASADEGRHAEHCASLAKAYGATEHRTSPDHVEDIAPPGLGLAERVLYEAVAACCITETVSVAVLNELFLTCGDDGMRRLLHSLLKDEVQHGRLGWSHLAHERSRRDIQFLGDFLPGMLEGTQSEELFLPPAPGKELERLREHGVLPMRAKREVFEDTLLSIVFPGLESMGVDARRGRDWLKRKGRWGRAQSQPTAPGESLHLL
jgi:hypothetical protein